MMGSFHRPDSALNHRRHSTHGVHGLSLRKVVMKEVTR